MKFALLVVYVIFYTLLSHCKYLSREPDYVKDDHLITFNKTDYKMQIRQGLRGKLKRWETCPKNDGSLDSILISMGIDYRSGLGNQVWSYLSIWAIARRHNIRPVLPEDNLNKLAKMFDRSYFNIPSLRTTGIRCNLLPWILDTHYHSALIVGKPKDLFKKIQVTPRENITLLKVQVYEFDVFHTAPLWHELANDLVIRKELRDGADQILKQVRQNYSENLNNSHSNHDLKQHGIEFVSAHIRRGDYEEHLNLTYVNATIVDQNYYLNAFKWLQKKMNKTLIMIVVTDDMTWAADNLVKGRNDIFLLGSGVSESPYQDLALLAACNHSIFAYGTFGLTGAFLAQGGYTIVFDTGNTSINLEMRIASNLPRWYIMDQHGALKYENEFL